MVSGSLRSLVLALDPPRCRADSSEEMPVFSSGADKGVAFLFQAEIKMNHFRTPMNGVRGDSEGKDVDMLLPDAIFEGRNTT